MTEVTDLEKPNPMEDEVLRAQRRMKMKEIKDSIIRDRPELYSPPSLTHVNEWKESLRKAEQSKSMDSERSPKGHNSFYPDQVQRNRPEDVLSNGQEYDVVLEDKDLNSSSKVQRRNSFKTKIFRNGNYNDVEDPGYSSASPYGNDITQSLPGGGSLNSSICSKVIFDERIYNKNEQNSKGPAGVEDHYFQSLKNFHSSGNESEGFDPSDSTISKPRNAFSPSDGNEPNDSFMSMFSRSLSKKLRRGTPPRKDLNSPKSRSAQTPKSMEGLELKDSQVIVEESWKSSPANDHHFLSRSVTASEFGDPDSSGTAKSKHSPPRTWLHSLSNLAGFVVNGKQGGKSNCLCKETEHHAWSRKISWGMFFFLLLIDIITIIIMMIVFDKLQDIRTIENISLASIAERHSVSQNPPPTVSTKSGPLLESITRRSYIPDELLFSENHRENILGPSSSTNEEKVVSTSRDERNIVISRTFNVFERSTERPTPSPSTTNPTTTTTAALLTPSTPSSTTVIQSSSDPQDDDKTTNDEEVVSILDIQREINDAKKDIYRDMDEIISNLNDEIQDLRNKIEVLKRPPVFSCYRTTEHRTEGVIKYTDCNIKSPGMNPATGKFTVQTPGIYRLTFTGLFKAINGHAVNADIIKRTYSGSFDFLGRSSADTDEIGTIFANDDSLMSTNTLTVMSPLSVADEVYVTMSIESNNDDSSIYSSANPAIHFNGEWVAVI